MNGYWTWVAVHGGSTHVPLPYEAWYGANGYLMSGRQHQVSAPKVCEWHVKPRDAAVLVINRFPPISNHFRNSDLVLDLSQSGKKMDKHEDSL